MAKKGNRKPKNKFKAYDPHNSTSLLFTPNLVLTQFLDDFRVFHSIRPKGLMFTFWMNHRVLPAAEETDGQH